MTETTDSIDQSPIVTDTPVADRRPSRLNQVAAWVGIVAGIVFIVGSVFFTGYFLGRHSGGGWHHRGGPQMEFRGGPGMGPGMMGPGMMGPGMMGPGRGPGMGPGMMGPDRDELPGPAQPPASPSAPAPRS